MMQKVEDFFHSDLSTSDPEVFFAIQNEQLRQESVIELIASENCVSRAVLQAQGSILTNKYAEGYPGARYYGGCEFVDVVENLAIQRAKALFNAQFANVQAHSGSQANQAVFFSLLSPHDTVLGMSLDCGGHLTHGSKVSMSGKWFNSVAYAIHKESGAVDYDQVAFLAEMHKPKLIIAGCSSYPRILDFAKFRAIADSVGAYLMVDMAHFAGLVATGMYPNPLPYAHVVTSTTHKTLRGARGGLILTNDEQIAKNIDRAVFPGIQGGPCMHIIAGKAVAFGEALKPEYTLYISRVVKNAQTMSSVLQSRGYDVFTSGTDCHLLLVDLRSHKLTGRDAEKSLERAGLTCNKNAIPFDNISPTITSGIRLGTPACTTRGFGEEEFAQVATMVADVLDSTSSSVLRDCCVIEQNVRQQVRELCAQYPLYGA